MRDFNTLQFLLMYNNPKGVFPVGIYCNTDYAIEITKLGYVIVPRVFTENQHIFLIKVRKLGLLLYETCQI